MIKPGSSTNITAQELPTRVTVIPKPPPGVIIAPVLSRVPEQLPQAPPAQQTAADIYIVDEAGKLINTTKKAKRLVCNHNHILITQTI